METREVNMPDHTSAFHQVKQALTEGEGKVIDDLSEVAAIGHRIVQGGSKYDRSVLVTEQVIQDIDDYAELAPLHNKAHVQGIRAAMAAFGPDVPEVVVFDTAFHQTMPPKAYMLSLIHISIPMTELPSRRYRIRKRGTISTRCWMRRKCTASCTILSKLPLSGHTNPVGSGNRNVRGKAAKKG